MRSMTGFGVGAAPLGSGRLVVELRALNHRYLDVRVRLPPELADQAPFVEQLARERLVRGRFDVGVRSEGDAFESRFDVERAKRVYRALDALRAELAPQTELPISALVALPDVVTSATQVDVDAARRGLRAAFEEAVEHLDKMRNDEGAALGHELGTRLESIRELLATIRARSAGLVELYRARLRERLERLLSDSSAKLDPGRLELEVALIADKSDVTEEVVRLDSHFTQFDRLLGAAEPVGRRLDFLLQEVARETNTVGAKCQDAPLSHLVIELRAEVERMREQVQNVE